MEQTKRNWGRGYSDKVFFKQARLRKLMQSGVLKPLSKDEMRKLATTLTLKKHNGST